MTGHWPENEREILNEHFFVMCEGMVNDDLLSLSQHLSVIEREAIARKLDFLAIDTAGAAFDLHDENNNGEVSRRVLKPLLKLARRLDCAVLMVHHIGKSGLEGGSSASKVNKPRGASVFTGYATSVFVLEADIRDPDVVTLTCAKRKSGTEYEVMLKLDRTTRFFAAITEQQRRPTNYERIVELVVSADNPVSPEELLKLDGNLSIKTINRMLAQAVKSGDVFKIKHGLYGHPRKVEI